MQVQVQMEVQMQMHSKFELFDEGFEETAFARDVEIFLIFFR